MGNAGKIVTLALATLLLAGCGLSPEERLERGEQALAHNRYHDARLDLASVLQDDPGNVDAMHKLVLAYLGLNDPDAALRMLGELNKVGKLPADSAALYGEAELQRGNFDKALAQVNGVETAQAFRVRALAYVGQKLPAKADAAFAAGMKATGPRNRISADYAHFLLETGELDRAEPLIDLARKQSPRDVGSYLVSADLALRQGNRSQALVEYDGALKAYPESRLALLGKVEVLGTLGRIDEVRKLVENGLKAAPGDMDFIYLSARLAAEDKDWSKVRGILQAQETRLGSHSLATTLYAKALMELGLSDQGRTILSSQLLREAGNRRARLLLGDAKLKAGDAAGAVETLQPFALAPNATTEELRLLAAAAQRMKSPDALRYRQLAEQAAVRQAVSGLMRGDAAIRKGDWAGAVAVYEALEMQNGGANAVIYNNLAIAHSNLGDRKQALTYAEKALKLAPGNPSVMDTVGWLLHQTGSDRARALALLEEAARRAPGNLMIMRHLQEARQA